MENRRLIVGVSGASGAPLAVETVRQLREMGVAVELIVTRGGEMTLREECGIGPQELAKGCEALYTQEEIGAGPASGSFAAMGMIVVPASMKKRWRGSPADTATICCFARRMSRSRSAEGWCCWRGNVRFRPFICATCWS